MDTNQKGSSFLKNPRNRLIIEIAVTVFIIGGLTAGVLYLKEASGRIYTDKASIEAPLIGIGSDTPSVLKEVLVAPGDTIIANASVARIGDTILHADTAGLIVGVNNEIGKLFLPGEAIVTMINPKDLRVVARIDENKGFSDIKIGQRAVFTVDAFGAKEFQGTVDEIAKTSVDSSAVFSISDKRETKQFIVKIKYNTEQNSQILNGMSARVWIYK